MSRQFIEGSMAVSQSVKLCRPDVIAAYPITPQTHIVEFLAQICADGELPKSQFINVESEFGAASVVLGASAVGARAYSATTAQGLLLMAEVLYNIAGMRLPVVLTIANRAISAPINIWNDHSDAVVLRDAGMIMLFVEDAQELMDIHPQAFKIAEDPNISLPVSVNMDGFVLTHSFEPVEMLSQKQVDDFLPPFKPVVSLDLKDPKTMGLLAEPTWYMETRYQIEETMIESLPVIEQTAKDFEKLTGRWYGGLLDTYRMEDAEIAFVAMGSLIGTLKDVVDTLRAKGEKVGIIKIRSFRPFPHEKLREVSANLKQLVVLDKSYSLGFGTILQQELRGCFYGQKRQPQISGFVVGLGGRDIPPQSLIDSYNKAKKAETLNEFVDLRADVVGRK
jgi:pyruvate ferredoxin oxidoreductase alpha subunit